MPSDQHCDGLAKLCLLQKVGLQLVKSTEHLCALQKEVRLQLRPFACCRIAKRVTARPQGVGISRASAKRSVLPENRGRALSIVTKKIAQLKKFDQHRLRSDDSSSARSMCTVCQTIVNCRSGHGHVYWMVIEIVMVADNIDVMSARAECGDHWKIQKHSERSEKYVGL